MENIIDTIKTKKAITALSVIVAAVLVYLTTR